LIKSVIEWGESLFPDFQILFRRGGRIVYVNLTATRQVSALAIALFGFLFLGYLGLRFQHFGHVVLSRNHMLADADRERVDLNQQVDALRDTLAEAEGRAEAVGEDNDRLTAALSNAQQRIALLEKERDHAVADARKQFKQRDAERAKALADAQRRIGELDSERTQLQANRADIEHKLASLQGQLNSRSGNLTQLSQELEKNRDLLRHSDSNQVALQTRIQGLEKDLAQVNLGAGKFKSDLASIDKRLNAVNLERERLVARQNQGLDDAVPEPTGAPEAQVAMLDTHSVADNPGRPVLRKGASKIEALIASTGLDVSRLLSDVSDSAPARAEGGPFVPLGAATSAGEDARRHKMLEKLVETLPLGAPLDHYRVESPFGPRRDPFNHRRGFHTGIDLSAPYRTHVFSTAPGIVIFAGAEGEWGRLVEIDNGHGIITRYAHMHRVFVVKGQKVPAHYAIGELGSTGRSTGPHVHYEVVVDGTPVDPAKFLGAGDNVIQVGAKQ
jgi:murein DD-endopeptidase MepM/ murein hydrolase activator NlpD